MTGQRNDPSAPAQVPDFTVVMRGWERRGVDEYIKWLFDTPPEQLQLPLTPDFKIVLRGYAPNEVQEFLERYVAHHLGPQ